MSQPKDATNAAATKVREKRENERTGKSKGTEAYHTRSDMVEDNGYDDLPTHTGYRAIDMMPTIEEEVASEEGHTDNENSGQAETSDTVEANTESEQQEEK